ncbi:MAG: hypothetical protein MEQ07_09735 [Aquimonas sp.]|nr:hypothetical protein [Aquimonas sp.]
MQWGYGWGEVSFEHDALDRLRRFQMGPLDLRQHHESWQHLQGITFVGLDLCSYAHNARGRMTQRERADRLYSLCWDSARRPLSTQAPGQSESYRYCQIPGMPLTHSTACHGWPDRRA